MKREIRRVEVLVKSQKRTVTFTVFAKKDPIRAAKRFSKQVGLGHLDYDWPNVTILTGSAPSDEASELDTVDADVFHGILSGEHVTETIV
jgi:hypothetical protein